MPDVDDPKRALDDAVRAADRTAALRHEAAQPEKLPVAVETMVDLGSWGVTMGVGVGGPAVLFLLCTLLAGESVEGGALANVIFWLGAPALLILGVVLGRRTRRHQLARVLAAGQERPADIEGAITASGAPIAIAPGADTNNER